MGSDVAQQQLPDEAVAAFVEYPGLGLDQYASEEIKPFGVPRIDDSFRASLKRVEDPMGVTITVLKALGEHATRYGTLSVEATGGFHVLVAMDKFDASLFGSVVTDLESLPGWSAYDGASVQVGGINEKPNQIQLIFDVPLVDTVDANRSALAAQAKLVNPNELFVSVADVPSKESFS